MNERTKDFIFYGIMFAYVALSMMVIAKEAKATQPFNATVQDHSKTIIKRVPQTWEVCSEVNAPGDKTADTLLGALIGGAIGQNITKDLPDGATAGAIIGGILGNQNSKTINGKQMKCTKNVRYQESMETIYSHSTITFNYEGRTYTVRFKK